MIVVGLAGRLRSGKTTVAQRLVARHGFIRRGVVDALYREVRKKFRRTLLAIAENYSGAVGSGFRPVGDDEIIDWLLEQKPPEVRALLQEFGTEVRRADDPDYWVKQWRDSLPPVGRIVNDQTRFPNEASAIRAWYTGVVVWIERPGSPGPLDSHASETSLTSSSCDEVLVNDGNLKDLEEKVDALVARLFPC